MEESKGAREVFLKARGLTFEEYFFEEISSSKAQGVSPGFLGKCSPEFQIESKLNLESKMNEGSKVMKMNEE